jgi:hypothetical protein
MNQMIEHWFFLSVLTGLGVFLLAGALSPIESLAWWAGWSEAPAATALKGATDPSCEKPDLFAVYLAGIDSISGNELTDRTKKLVAGLKTAASSATIITNVFPYAPSGRPLLAGPRLFIELWKRIDNMKRGARGRALASLINFRNFYQVLVSADHRYGPLFNAGAAHVIFDALMANGYDPDTKPRIVIIGYSGGAQVAIGAAEYLKLATGARISVISLGGTMASSPGIGAVDRIYHLYGSNDRVQKFAAIMFPERWAVFPHSYWNIAKAEGRISPRYLGNMGHDGAGGYLGENADSDGESFISKTVAALASLLETESSPGGRRL